MIDIILINIIKFEDNYDIIDYKDCGGKMKVKLSKYQLADIVRAKYKRDYNDDVSPLKLQKSLYFLFGYWILEQVVGNENEEVGEISYLFDANFQAWKYGPVEVDVYYNKNLNEEKLLEISPKINDFLESKLEMLFKVSDFSLVNITHEHKSWQDKYDIDNQQSSMDNSDIEKVFRDMLND